MNEILKDIVNHYENMKNKVYENFSIFFNKKECFFFWQRWTLLHENLFSCFDLDLKNKDESDFQAITHFFMKKRLAMVSAFSQGLKKDSLNLKEDFYFLKIILKDHDKLFLDLLSKLLSYLSFELTKIQKVRKVVTAYSHSQFSVGG